MCLGALFGRDAHQARRRDLSGQQRRMSRRVKGCKGGEANNSPTMSVFRRATIMISALLALVVVSPSHAVDAPPNDNRADATVVSTLPFREQVDTSNATTEPDADSYHCGSGEAFESHSIWYSFTAERTGDVVVTASSDSIGLAIIAPGGCATGGPWTITAEAGRTYEVVIASLSGHGGMVSVAFLNASGKIAGTTSSTSGRRIYFLCVGVHEESLGFRGLALTQEDGTFVVEGLPEGDDVVRFYDCQYDNFPRYLEEYYDDTADRADARLVHVPDSTTAFGINAALTPANDWETPPREADLTLTSLTARYETFLLEGGDRVGRRARAVEVGIRNAGDASLGRGWLSVRACEQDGHACVVLLEREIPPMHPWATDLIEIEIDFDGIDFAGDVTIDAAVCGDPDDGGGMDDYRSVKVSSLIEGTGIGFARGIHESTASSSCLPGSKEQFS